MAADSEAKEKAIVTTFTREVTIDLSDTDSASAEAFCKFIDRDPCDLPGFSVEVDVEVDLDDFDRAEIVDFYHNMIAGNWIERTYRYLAEGNCGAAMEEMAREFSHLAPPSHECAIADLLSGKRVAANG